MPLIHHDLQGTRFFRRISSAIQMRTHYAFDPGHLHLPASRLEQQHVCRNGYTSTCVKLHAERARFGGLYITRKRPDVPAVPAAPTHQELPRTSAQGSTKEARRLPLAAKGTVILESGSDIGFTLSISSLHHNCQTPAIPRATARASAFSATCIALLMDHQKPSLRYHCRQGQEDTSTLPAIDVKRGPQRHSRVERRHELHMTAWPTNRMPTGSGPRDDKATRLLTRPGQM
ncbi:hypothetical protein AC578_3214 [Pseudocercospora eumusae]|uniref:Uncharacterized protein n=1 Tax=Pseudocercospora eumusae TaxID=321146 RepID=A0A139H242_9PEZI|nr:hypothetical protein AC578_3214 [Pseudocercospora eumusae]